jgi:hypothetical protein
MAKIFAISVSTFKGVPKFDRHSDGLNLAHVTKKAQLGELASDQKNQPKIQASDKTKTRPHASALPPRSFPRAALTRKSDLEGVIPTDLGISREPIFHSRNHHKLAKI